MRILYGPSIYNRPAIACLGIFDGVHIGHKYLFRFARQNWPEYTILAISFHPHPVDVLTGAHMPLILPLDRRIQRIKRCGIAPVIIEFSRELANMQAREFIAEARDVFGVKEFVVGRGFVLGRDQIKGEFLSEFVCLEPRYYEGMAISSTRIRQALMDGNIYSAHRMLGYYPRIWGTVIKGDGMGRKIGFPTANLLMESDCLIRDGIYAVSVRYGGSRHKGVMHIGPRPTVGSMERRVEIHILEFEGVLYNKKLEVVVREFLREGKRFSSILELRKAIKGDIERASAVFGRQGL